VISYIEVPFTTGLTVITAQFPLSNNQEIKNSINQINNHYNTFKKSVCE